jgi:hypothetical protein
VPLFAGLLPVLVDDRRRGLHDLIAGTIVLYSEEEPPAEPLPACTTVRSDPPTGPSSTSPEQPAHDHPCG